LIISQEIKQDAVLLNFSKSSWEKGHYLHDQSLPINVNQ
tara:strand:- start:2569 stop:2685 length:117 start_codon:yes stop_codon:yes gene_type:complete